MSVLDQDLMRIALEGVRRTIDAGGLYPAEVAALDIVIGKLRVKPVSGTAIRSRRHRAKQKAKRQAPEVSLEGAHG